MIIPSVRILALTLALAVSLRAQGPTGPTEIDPGELVSTSPNQLRTTWDHEDLDLSFDYKLAPNEHAAVYLLGRYRIPLAGSETHDGSWSQAAKAAGLWQHLHLLFHAPRLAPNKNPTEARLELAELNHYPVLLQQPFPAPSSDAPLAGESSRGPVIFTSDHPLQLRHIQARQLAVGKKIALETTKAELFPSDQALVRWSATSGRAGSDREELSLTPTSPKTIFTQAKPSFAALFTANLTAPVAGTYTFAAESSGLSQIYVDGAHALGPVPLTAGLHTLQVTFLRKEGNTDKPSLAVEIEADTLAGQTFYFGGTKPKVDPERHSGKPILKLAGQKIVVQRAFVPFGSGKRLETISVGTPQHLNYTYDLDNGTLLRAWRGEFLDMYNMWHERGEAQIASPLGAALTFDGGATFGDTLQPGGYDLEPSGQPTFTATYHGRTVSDRIAPNVAGTGFTRTLKVSAGPEPITVTLARGGEMIAVTPNRYTVSDGSYYVEWHPQANEARLEVTGSGAQSALVVTLPASDKSQEISYDIAW